MIHAVSEKDFFNREDSVADLGLIVAPGAKELGEKINGHLVRWAQRVGMDKETFIIPSECPRFSSGDGKGRYQEHGPGATICISSWMWATTAASTGCSARKTA